MQRRARLPSPNSLSPKPSSGRRSIAKSRRAATSPPPPDYRRSFPDGRIGANSALATPEAGKRLYELAVAGLSKEYQSWLHKADVRWTG
jgi:creatinine amidohydrolase/Fe(II)-dependent formamide hydrolase-like protein